MDIMEVVIVQELGLTKIMGICRVVRVGILSKGTEPVEKSCCYFSPSFNFIIRVPMRRNRNLRIAEKKIVLVIVC